MSPRPDQVKIDVHETHRLLTCLHRAAELALDHDNLDVVVMAEELMDMLTEKWERATGA